MTRLQRPGTEDPTSGAGGQFLLVSALEALERWQRDPSPDTRRDVAASLAGILSVAGASGAVLEICAPPLPTLEVGAGTLAAIPPVAERAGLARFSLGSDAGHGALGSLYLDAPAGAVQPVVRTIEIAVDAAWSRAEVRARVERLAALEAATRAVAAELDIDRVLGVRAVAYLGDGEVEDANAAYGA